MVKHSVDTLIIGGGPAGSFLASEVKEGDVALVDKKRIIYSPVVCGEMVPADELLRGHVPDELLNIIDYTLYKSLSKEVVLNTIRRLRILAYVEGKVFEMGELWFPAYIVDKGLMIKRLIENGVNAGISVSFSTQVTECVRERFGFKCRVLSKDGEEFVKAGRLVGADGYPSVVMSLVGGGFSSSDLALATSQRAKAYVNDDEALVIIGPELAPGGYAWIFPRGDVANVGLGIRGDVAWLSGVDLRGLHLRFLEKFSIRPIQKAVFVKTIPVGELSPVVERGGVYLAGDAAGTVVPTNGAGINSAMVSGFILSKSLRGEVNYTLELNRTLGGFLKLMHRLRYLADPYINDPVLFMRLISIMPPESLTWVLSQYLLGTTNNTLVVLSEVFLKILKNLKVPRRHI